MMTLLVVVLMILSALVIALPGTQGREYGMNPAATSSGNIQPNPTLNVNVSWSTFQHGWNPLEYNNGTANLTLNAQASTLYPNYISVNPADIQANGSLTNNGLGTNKTSWDSYFDHLLSSTPQTISIKNGAAIDTFNTSTTEAQSAGIYGTIPITYYPSDNIAYDYLTMIVGFSGHALTGAQAWILFQNGTDSAQSPTSTTMQPNQIQYVS